MNDKIAYHRKFAKEYLIPFYGDAMNANISKDPERIFWGVPSGSFQPVWILPIGVFQTSKEVNDCLSVRVHKGSDQRRNGRRTDLLDQSDRPYPSGEERRS